MWYSLGAHGGGGGGGGGECELCSNVSAGLYVTSLVDEIKNYSTDIFTMRQAIQQGFKARPLGLLLDLI